MEEEDTGKEDNIEDDCGEEKKDTVKRRTICTMTADGRRGQYK